MKPKLIIWYENEDFSRYLYSSACVMLFCLMCRYCFCINTHISHSFKKIFKRAICFYCYCFCCCYSLKLVSAIFYLFTKWQPFKNYKKCFLFNLKSSFCSRDIQIFVFFPFLSTLFRFKRTNESGKIHNVMNWLA